MKTHNPKKGSAMITTILVMLLVCALVTAMLALGMYSQSLSKTAERVVTRQNRLDMLTDLFLEYNTVPVEKFGYTIDVYYFEDGSSTMTVRQKPNATLCDMIVEQRNGELIARYYDAPYTHTQTVCNRTIGVHNVSDTKPYLQLSIPKSAVSANGPFYVYGRIKLERALPINGNSVEAFVNLAGDGKDARTVMHLFGNTDGWINLQNSDGTPLKFENIPTDSLQFLFGLNNTSGDLTVSDLVVVNSQDVVCYSLANDPYINGIGDVRSVLSPNNKWKRFGFTENTTTAPIVTRDPDSYIPNKVLSVSQSDYVCSGEPFLALYKSALRDDADGGEGFYYITGRFRVNLTGHTELCDKSPEKPNGMLLDVHESYDHDNNDSTPNISSKYPADAVFGDSVFYAKSGCWAPIVNRSGEYYKFYVPADCARNSEDYIKFTIWGATGTFDVADIRVYKLADKNAVPNPASDTLVYDMEADTTLTNKTYPGCALGGESKINGVWSIHWLEYKKYPGLLNTTIPSKFQVHSIVNPTTVSHSRGEDYDLPVFINKVGATYQPQ